MKTAQPGIKKQLTVTIVIAVLGAAVVGALLTWEQRSAPPPDRAVTIYRAHGCTCAFALAESLTAAGFEVKVVEVASLAGARATLHTTPNLRGCHVGAYLGYFVEGHVPPAALLTLAAEHPAALGIVTAASVESSAAHVSIERDQQSGVLLMEPNSSTRPWLEPALDGDPND